MKKRSSYRGLQKGIRKLKTPGIETWKNQYPDKKYIINIETSEFTCICPKTGLPDFATIKIRYTPDKYCLELKSFKNYLLVYRNVGIFHEHAVNMIFDDFIKACKPRWAYIEGDFNIRGGVKTIIYREYKKK